MIRQMQINLRNKQSLSEQIREELLHRIESGELAPGDSLPTVRELADQLKVNFNTVARAYRVLDLEGWIVTRQGRGTFVFDVLPETQAPSGEQVKRELLDLIARLEKTGAAHDDMLEIFEQVINEERRAAPGPVPEPRLRLTPPRKARRTSREAPHKMGAPIEEVHRKHLARRIRKRLPSRK